LYSAELAASPRRSLWTRSWIQFVAVASIVASTYFVIARLSLGLLTPDGVAVFWPAAGIASGTLIVLGRSARWAVMLGVVTATIAANLLSDRNLPSSIFFALANAGEAVLIASLVKFRSAEFELGELRQVLTFVGATAAATATSGIAGTLGFVFFHSSTVSPPMIWLHWFAADALGSIIVAPLIIGLRSLLDDPPSKNEFAEAGLALAAVILFCGLFIYLPKQPWTFELGLAGLTPIFIWIAARFRPAITAIASFIYASTIVWTTILGFGIFGDPRLSIEARVLSAQGAILAVVSGAFVLASLFSERRRYEDALLERETRLEDALQTGRILAYSWDVLGETLQFSPNAAELLGLGSSSELGAAEWLERIHPDDRRKIIARVHEWNEDTQPLTFRYVRPEDSTEIFFEQTAVVQFNKQGYRTHLNGLMCDISERTLFEEHIVLARKSAETANLAKTSFLSAASHDLRQPLQTLRFLQAALAQRELDEGGLSLVSEIGSSIETMSGILSSLLDINRLETGNTRVSISDVAIQEVFDSISSDFSRSAAEKGLAFRRVPSRLVVRTDRHLLQEMLRNLLSNAVRYTDRGKILIGCRVRGDRVRIEVSDTGIGISEDQLLHIFDEYYQSAEGAERGGFGLGLAIVKRLGDLLQHPIEVRSKPGKGTVFCIEVPRGRKAISPASIRAGVYPQSNFTGSVMVVEDERSIRSAVTTLFRSLGIQAHVFATAEHALAAVRDEHLRPAVIICDYNLLGSISGIECVDALRANIREEVPAIIITGDMRSKTAEALAAKRISLLLKPFSAQDLVLLMNQAIETMNATSSPVQP
jgi:signal transduction histidine kinase/CheY-like chemotaxis protein